MAVFRIEKTRDYTVMSNHHLRNTGLSLKSKVLLSMMLSLPEDWDYTIPIAISFIDIRNKFCVSIISSTLSIDTMGIPKSFFLGIHQNKVSCSNTAGIDRFMPRSSSLLESY